MNAYGYTPTFANILSSLHIKGSTLTGGAGKGGRVPVLDDDGILDISTIPVEELSLSLSIPPLAKTAYVDPQAGSGVSQYTPDGSIAAPFRTLDSAAASSAKFSNFILASGTYGVSSPVFTATDSTIRIFSTGTASFTSLYINGFSQTTELFIFNNISVSSVLQMSAQRSCRIMLTGYGSVTSVIGAVSDPDDPDISTWYLDEVGIGPCLTVSSLSRVTKVTYIASSSRIANASSVIEGSTVTDVIDRLAQRRIRIPVFSTDSSGIDVGESDIEIETSDSSVQYEYYAITILGTSLAAAVNATFYKRGDSPEFSDITAETVTADTVYAGSVETSVIRLGTSVVYVNDDDFLVINEDDSSYDSSSSSGSSD